jgi:hypothetical protein
MSDSEEADHSAFNKKLEAVLHEVGVLTERTYELARSLREPIKPYTHTFTLIPAAQKVLKQKTASLKDLTHFFLATWKAEGRLGVSGRTVRVGLEAELLGLGPEQEVDVYTVCERLSTLLV